MNTVDFASDPPVIWEIYNRVAGTRAFDVGANGGMVSRLLCERFDEVHAFEPAVESYFSLTSGSMPAHLTPHNLAVSDHDGTVVLDERVEAGRLGELTSGETMTRSWGPQTGTREVRCRTVDSLAAEFGDPDFIKVDTEGHERAVIDGALETVERCDPRLLIEVHDRDQGRWIMDALGGSFTQVRHPAYLPGTDYFEDHWFLLRGV